MVANQTVFPLRLVRTAVLVQERPGRLETKFVAVEDTDFTALSDQDRRPMAVLLRQLRFIAWLLRRDVYITSVQVNDFSSHGHGSRSLVIREAGTSSMAIRQGCGRQSHRIIRCRNYSWASY
jgi:hypothetical protein